jgi:hypothetical protein
LQGLLLGFVEKNGDRGRAVDDTHMALRSSMISCGERLSRIGRAAICVGRAGRRARAP